VSSYYKLSLDLVLKPIDVIGTEAHEALTKLCRLTDMNNVGPLVDEYPRSCWPAHEFWESYNFERIGNTCLSFDYRKEPEEVTSYVHPNLIIRADINYGHEAIHSFMDWVLPYVESMKNDGRYDDENNGDDLTSITLKQGLDGSPVFLFQSFQRAIWNDETCPLKLIGEVTLNERWMNKAQHAATEAKYAAMRAPKQITK
jgi:hypothetical protein